MRFQHRVWSGTEWEQHIQLLLKRKYELGDYHELPDKHVGDFGLEGFGTDGRAYQCYAAQDYTTSADLYEKQRNKISDDIRKFVRNRDDLGAVFGRLKISRWLLVVPEHDSAKLVQFCAKKTEEVLAVDLPYVTSDFRIGVITDDHFALEKQQLAHAGAIRLDFVPTDPDYAEIAEWGATNSALIERMRTKVKRVSSLRNQEQQDDFVEAMVKDFVAGQTILSELRSAYPDLYQALIRIKGARERRISFRSRMAVAEPGVLLTTELDELKEDFEQAVAGLGEETLQVLTFESLADWLMRCPLSF